MNTHIKLYFNVTRSDSKAFLFYLGNIEHTHTKMPLTSTDDFIAAEIVEGGRVKLTIGNYRCLDIRVITLYKICTADKSS